MIPHRVFAKQGEPQWNAEPRFELGPALQQADALPPELRRILDVEDRQGQEVKKKVQTKKGIERKADVPRAQKKKTNALQVPLPR